MKDLEDLKDNEDVDTVLKDWQPTRPYRPRPRFNQRYRYKHLDKATALKISWVLLPLPILAIVGLLLKDFPDWMMNCMWLDVLLGYLVYAVFCIKQKCWVELGMLTVTAIGLLIVYIGLNQLGEAGREYRRQQDKIEQVE